MNNLNENEIVDYLTKYCEERVLPALKSANGKVSYPKDIISDLADMGFFGINIPAKFGGSKLPLSLNLKLNRILSRYWLVIPALYGTHLRANQYFLTIATEKQKEKYLPKMATGEMIAAHPFHEKSIKNPELFNTNISLVDGKYILNGQKEWVTNAKNADFFITVAKNEIGDKLSSSAIIIDPSRQGVEISDELPRSGLHEVSLCRVSFNNVVIDADEIIGGVDQSATNFVTNFRAISSLNFSARCVGVADSLIDLIKPYVALDERAETAKAVIAYNWAEVSMLHKAIVAYFERALALHSDGKVDMSEAYLTKIYCSSTLQMLVRKVRMLSGGSGYAGDDHNLIRQLNDAGSLELIDTPNDILQTWAGLNDLKES